MKNVFTVFKRELKSYFDSPVAYVFLTAFLVLAGFLTFVVGVFYERRQADLAPFFFWHPWIYLLLVPAATMGLWADERRNGTAELLLTLPLTVWQVLTGKFLAAWAFIALALALTLPVPLTAAYLGAPDWGVVACGYLGSLLLAGAATAIGLFASTLSRSSVVGFVTSLAMVFGLLIIGFDPVSGALAGWGVSPAIVDGIASLSLLTHFEAIKRGVVDLADIGYYVGAIMFFIAAAKTVTDGRRGVRTGLLGLAAIAVIAVAADVILAALPLRSDFTAERLYTLSRNSKAVLGKLDAEVSLKFYFSANAKDMPMAYKTYAERIKDLLEEYVRAAGGSLTLEEYDPEPDSDAEDWAQRYGVEPQTVNPFGAPVYFGLVAACGDRVETIGAFSPQTEATLEYDITRLITRAVWPERPVIGVMTSLDGVLGGDFNPMMMQMGQRPPQGWAAFTELGKDYETREIKTDVEEIPADVKALVLLHAKNLSDKTLYAIDQFVLRGGRLVACTDPMCATELMSEKNRMGMGMGSEGSTLGKLFDVWGVKFAGDQVTCDLAAATKLSGRNGAVESEPAFLSLGRDNFATTDVLVHNLSQIMLPFAGAFTFAPTNDNALVFTPVVTTAAETSGAAPKMSMMMGRGSSETAPDGVARVVVARLEGEFKTAFPQGPEGTNALAGAKTAGRGRVLLVADADFLSDAFCVRTVRTPFGNVVQPLNDNLPFFSSVIEQFAGREELIGLRTRGAADRPFEVVDKLEAEAMAKWQQKEAELKQRLQTAQERITMLQKQKSGNERYLLSAEQQAEIVKANEARANAARDLKNVRKELTAGIDALGQRVKWVNILLVPLLVVAFGIFRAVRRRA